MSPKVKNIIKKLKPIFKKVQKNAIFKINYYVIWTIFLKWSSIILLDFVRSLNKC